MKNPLRFAFFILIAVLLTFPVSAQDNLSLLRVSFNTVKNQTTLDENQQKTIEQLEWEAQNAAANGENTLAAYLYRKGLVLLRGQEWTPEKAFENSIEMTGGNYYFSPGGSVSLQLVQKVKPDLLLSGNLSGTLSVLQQQGRRFEKIADVKTDIFVQQEFTENPAVLTFTLPADITGSAVIRLSISDQEGRAIAEKQFRVGIISNLEERLNAILSGIDEAKEKWSGKREGLIDVLPTIQYSLELLKSPPAGLRSGTISAQLDRARTLLTSVLEGNHPFEGKTGDIHKAYIFRQTEELLPYRLYIPSSYDGSTPFPLIVALHGLGADENSFFDSYGGTLVTLAEQHGYIVVGPLGYRRDGFYGVSFQGRQKPYNGYGEDDVLQVLEIVRKDYNIDENRTYLMGHSMGGIGSWYLAGEHPEIFAAIAPFSGLGDPRSLTNITHIPQFVVHGDADPTVAVSGSRTMVEAAKKLDIVIEYIEVPGGNHINVVEPNLAKMIEFFSQHKKQKK
ncbi:alpha/beta fold hydrolase [candidate division KSB1 bacterium]